MSVLEFKVVLFFLKNILGISRSLKWQNCEKYSEKHFLSYVNDLHFSFDLNLQYN